MKETVVHFHNGRVEKLTNPDKSSLPGIFLVEPDLSKVAGIPPEFWRLSQDGKEILPQEGHVPDDKSLAVLRQHQAALAQVGVVQALNENFEHKSEDIKKYIDEQNTSITEYVHETCVKLDGQMDVTLGEVYDIVGKNLALFQRQRDTLYERCKWMLILSATLCAVTLLLLLVKHGG